MLYVPSFLFLGNISELCLITVTTLDVCTLERRKESVLRLKRELIYDDVIVTDCVCFLIISERLCSF